MWINQKDIVMLNFELPNGAFKIKSQFLTRIDA